MPWDGSYSSLKPINAGVPQKNILGPILYVSFTLALPVSENSITATFADYTRILAIGDDEIQSTRKLQEDVNDTTRKAKPADFTNKKRGTSLQMNFLGIAESENEFHLFL